MYIKIYIINVRVQGIFIPAVRNPKQLFCVNLTLFAYSCKKQTLDYFGPGRSSKSSNLSRNYIESLFSIKNRPKVAERFAKTTPKVVTWELKVRQMGLQKKDLAKIMVDQLNLTCSPDQYLEETYKYHLELFGNVSEKSIIMLHTRTQTDRNKEFRPIIPT